MSILKNFFLNPFQNLKFLFLFLHLHEPGRQCLFAFLLLGSGWRMEANHFIQSSNRRYDRSLMSFRSLNLFWIFFYLCRVTHFYCFLSLGTEMDLNQASDLLLLLLYINMVR